MELFDFINVIFNNPEEYSKIPNGEKRKHFFMVNRRFAIQFPLQANVLQLNGISQEYVMDFWQTFMRQQYKKTPSWLYIKGVKKSVEVKEKKQNISNKVIQEYAKFNNIQEKTVKDALEIFYDDMLKELKEFEKNFLK